jgi:hypothetical protein
MKYGKSVRSSNKYEDGTPRKLVPNTPHFRMTTSQKLAAIPLAGALLLGGGAIAGYAGLASAQTSTSTGSTAGAGQSQHQRGVFGTITAINGSTIIVQSRGFGPRNSQASTTQTTYTIDASGATVTKDGATGSVSSLAVGDMIMAEGTVNGTSVTATAIHDGKGPGMGHGMGPGGRGMGPGIQGTVSGMSGNTITVTGSNGTTYTVNASSATVDKLQQLSVSDIRVGDTVGIQGQVSGSSVTAKHIMDGIPPNRISRAR